jgi:hypothetical protein
MLGMSIRFHIEPRDVPPVAAARCMGLTLEVFTEQLPALLRRGFPPADPTTGNYDLDAIDAWRKLRHPQLFAQPSLTAKPGARNANDVVALRLAGKVSG